MGNEVGLLNLSTINVRKKLGLFNSPFLRQKVQVNLEIFQAACGLYLFRQTDRQTNGYYKHSRTDLRWC